MSKNKSDASQCIQDAVANMSPDIKNRIAETMKIEIPRGHALKDDGFGCSGFVHSSENVIFEKDRIINHEIKFSDDELQLIVHGLMDLGEKASIIGRDFDDIVDLMTRLAPFMPK